MIKGFFSIGSGIGDLSVHEGLDFGNFLSSKDGIFPDKVGFPPPCELWSVHCSEGLVWGCWWAIKLFLPSFFSRLVKYRCVWLNPTMMQWERYRPFIASKYYFRPSVPLYLEQNEFVRGLRLIYRRSQYIWKFNCQMLTDRLNSSPMSELVRKIC